MARSTRSRSRASPYKGGVALWINGAGTVTNTFAPDRSQYVSTCLDWTGSPVVDSSFDSRQYTGVYPSISGSINPTFGSAEARYNAFTVMGLPSAMTGVLPLPAPNGWMLDLVAGTNPSRPVLNIPEAVENIVSLPRMVKSLGDLIMSPASKMNPKGFAGEYLGVQFGWRPLIDDLTKLLNIQSYVIKRNRELHQLYSGKGLRRRLKFADDTTNAAVNSQTSVGISVITQSCSLTVKREQWATIHWYPTSLPPYHPDDPRWNLLTHQLVLGATPEAMLNGIWKVIPWTWLIGWFTNFGKYTLANSWTIPATHGAGCFMSKAEATYQSAGVTWTNTRGGSLSHSGKASRVVRMRQVSSTVTAGANMPYLDMFRLSILGSLFVQKFLPHSRT
jgi:hypothetical protein